VFFVKTPVTGGIIKLLMALGSGELSRKEIQDKLKLKDRRLFMSNYINIALEGKYIEMTIPDKPNSHLQKYKIRK
jgi:hypothetical protein